MTSSLIVSPMAMIVVFAMPVMTLVPSESPRKNLNVLPILTIVAPAATPGPKNSSPTAIPVFVLAAETISTPSLISPITPPPPAVVEPIVIDS